MDFKFHTFEAYITDLYVAEYRDKILILDCGSRSDHSLFVDIIERQLNRRMSDVALLVVTHLHPDHAGSAVSLSKKYAIPVAAPQGINLWYRGPGGKLQHFIDCQLAHFAVQKKGGPFRVVRFPYSINADYVLTDNQKLPFFSDWRSIASPGHTAHDIVLYNEARQILYCSDCIIRINDKYLSPFPVTDLPGMRKSLDRLSGLQVKQLALAHGGIIDISDMTSVIDEVTERFDKPLSGMMKYIRPFTGLSHEV